MKRKIIIGFILVILMSSIISGSIASKLIQNQYMKNVTEELIDYNILISESLNYFERVDTQTLNELTAKLGDKSDLRITLIDIMGNVIGDTDAIASELDNHRYREEIKTAFEGELGISKRHSATLDKDMLYVAMPHRLNENISIIRVSMPLTDIDNYTAQLFYYLLLGALVGTLLSIIVGYFYAKSIVRPVNDLIGATKDISAGNYEKKLYFNRKDELSALATHFNIMSETLRDKMMELKTNNKEMDVILESMKNGVIAVDREKKIIFLNKAAEKLFNIREEEVDDKNILEAIHNYKIEEYIARVLMHKNDSIEDEIRFENNRIYKLFIRPMYSEVETEKVLGVLLMFEDVTEVRHLERMRQDFVANVSHELKTPLTSIKGFAETLKNGAMENPSMREKFINIIDVEAARIIALTKDLLSLSEIEAQNANMEENKIFVAEIVREAVEILEMSAKEKPVNVNLDIEADLPELKGDPNWFKQITVNLIDNAIKYTPENGDIKVDVRKDDKHLILEIVDTGIGISEEHIDRIFERFYRADKARSRNAGGTGLGLSIVKHIVIAFNGKIDVQSELGKGTKFIVSLPYEN
jgi:two-component system phosphate regulon sensor histidine kinase PhoR